MCFKRDVHLHILFFCYKSTDGTKKIKSWYLLVVLIRMKHDKNKSLSMGDTQSMSLFSFSRLIQVIYKARSMEHPVRIRLTKNDPPSRACQVGWGCRIHRLLLCKRVKTHPTNFLKMTLNSLSFFYLIYSTTMVHMTGVVEYTDCFSAEV